MSARRDAENRALAERIGNLRVANWYLARKGKQQRVTIVVSVEEARRIIVALQRKSA